MYESNTAISKAQIISMMNPWKQYQHRSEFTAWRFILLHTPATSGILKWDNACKNRASFFYICRRQTIDHLHQKGFKTMLYAVAINSALTWRLLICEYLKKLHGDSNFRWAECIIKNMNTFIFSFLNSGITQIVEMFPSARQEVIYSI